MKTEKLSFDFYPKRCFDLDVFNSHRATNSIYGCCPSSRPLKDFDEAEKHLHELNKKYALQPTDDKFHDRFDCILKSRESLLPIQSLRTEVLHPSCFLNTVRLVDMKQLKEIVIRKSCEQSAKKDKKDMIFNEIVELDVFKYIQVLNISDFKVTVPLETFLHIPDLTVSVSTLTIEDVLLIKKNMFNSPTAKSRCVHFDHVENEDALHNTLGHANPENYKISWYYKLPESDQTLQISKANYYNLSYLLNVAEHIDVEQLRGIVIRKTPGYSDREKGNQPTLDEIVELDVFDCIPVLSISDFKVTLPLETFLHIPVLRVSISTVTIEDVILIKENMLTSPTAKSRRVFYDSIKDADALHNTLGHANPDDNKVSWYFKLPESDQMLQISKANYPYCFSFSWIKTLCISEDAVVQ
ncbi:hypothetical protein GCK72_011458 [Caenorhabditis remanei]|uniref:DUF38 domain-containing protein n=1 Tax=Caenorhabditis remanei TaxID=31234 RepID=A0A6A5H967_CAERE|nr:hypothetical protein GCK72_011217 [Caenorhabditis remanei]XP_053588040.1 hypothetical protein GCK72_011458 [Caenorhabditis remanei]KAF1762952.1 hypothetical protein GCK72_011217 [Caenorhabditis remanei]KAF1763192.1 hypothetical protein GCK72_011458 [Caenorhabditis remanei]